MLDTADCGYGYGYYEENKSAKYDKLINPNTSLFVTINAGTANACPGNNAVGVKLKNIDGQCKCPTNTFHSTQSDTDKEYTFIEYTATSFFCARQAFDITQDKTLNTKTKCLFKQP